MISKNNLQHLFTHINIYFSIIIKPTLHLYQIVTSCFRLIFSYVVFFRMTKMARVHKFPMCREVKTLVTHVYRPFYDAMTDVKTGSEICEVVLSGVAQIVFKVECVGHKKTSQCRFHYAPQEDYYCRPTNYVTRTMVILCPSDNGILTYHVEKIPTACSCVKVGCDDMFTTKKLL
ncbi:Hypothetical predicted protein [Mytilus galloprovincialis]|uniref:Spaetzle domain-containing protein n=1 Tax=Mytilus galloprovincialis TaxID=29158 RepID=A0A8B6BLM4_MYTGA|nr:Hypothetical predicted protein [Mytilus galloprovincialis]